MLSRKGWYDLHSFGRRHFIDEHWSETDDNLWDVVGNVLTGLEKSHDL